MLIRKTFDARNTPFLDETPFSVKNILFQRKILFSYSFHKRSTTFNTFKKTFGGEGSGHGRELPPPQNRSILGFAKGGFEPRSTSTVPPCPSY